MEVIRVVNLGTQPFDPAVFETRVFDSKRSFMRQFREGLYALLCRDDVTESQVVLVANNAIATGDGALFLEAMARASRIRRTDSNDRAILDYLSTNADPMRIIHRRVTDEGFVLVHNHLRRLRTNHVEEERRRQGEASKPMSLLKEFNPAAFNFNKVPNERFASVWCASGRVELYYNKTPYYGWHVLCVPVPENNYSQYLSRSMVSLWQELFSLASTALPGCVMGYNSLGAWASINQLHFHLIYGDDTLVMPGRSEGGFGLVPGDRTGVWPMIDGIQQADQPFNLIEDHDGLLVVQRLGQHRPGPDWSTGFAWFELAGGFIVIRPERFWTITGTEIWRHYRKLMDLAA